ncbi:MAG: 4'-phosphopantetheinyl transferase superfamily protein [Rhodobacterales bacterium]|nr:4'-phosphopantetheinyl transferase superfamily protein [Rhodobacterales bacterium]
MTRATGPVETALRSLFPDKVAVAAERIVSPDAKALWPGEHAGIAGAVASRLAEFVAGRTAARRVLRALGQPEQALPMGPDRAAIWPDGIAGSIAHAAGIAVAVGWRGAAVGVDIEADAEIAPDLWEIVCRPEELGRLAHDGTGRLVQHIYCAKEAVFKAQEPGRRAMFGHEVLSVTLAGTRFDAHVLKEAGAFQAGQIVRGRMALLDGLVLAGVAM